jgi:TRAP transporter TAXI family solute receptor
VAALALVAALFTSPSYAQRSHGNDPIPNKPELGRLGDKINSNTIAIVSGNINAAWLTIAYDLSAVLDRGNDFRVLPIIGKGGAQNVRDVRYLKGVDLGITVTPVLSAFRRSGELGNIDNKIVYITKLFNDEMHVLVRADSGITSIQQLAGKKMNFSNRGSATQVSSRDFFKRLGIPVQEVNMGQSDAYEAMKRGEIAGTIQFGGKPAPSIAKLKPSDGIRLLPVPFSKPFQEDYLPATLTSKDYPNLIKKGEEIETIAYGAVIIAYNWPKGSERHRRIAKFVDEFFSHFAEFQKPPRHPKWREVNLAATLPGWKRFDEAEEWLKHHRAQSVATRDEFDEFLASHANASAMLATEQQRERLFRAFLQWRRDQKNN